MWNEKRFAIACVLSSSSLYTGDPSLGSLEDIFPMQICRGNLNWNHKWININIYFLYFSLFKSYSFLFLSFLSSTFPLPVFLRFSPLFFFIYLLLSLSPSVSFFVCLLFSFLPVFCFLCFLIVYSLLSLSLYDFFFVCLLLSFLAAFYFLFACLLLYFSFSFFLLFFCVCVFFIMSFFSESYTFQFLVCFFLFFSIFFFLFLFSFFYFFIFSTLFNYLVLILDLN